MSNEGWDGDQSAPGKLSNILWRNLKGQRGAGTGMKSGLDWVCCLLQALPESRLMKALLAEQASHLRARQPQPCQKVGYCRSAHPRRLLAEVNARRHSGRGILKWYHNRYLGSSQTSERLLGVYRIRLFRDIFFGADRWQGRSKTVGFGSTERTQRKQIVQM